MPFLAIGSSGLSSAHAATSPEVIDKLEALGVDQPLPNEYFQDRIRLLVQSPRRIFAYWEFSRDPFESLRLSLGSRSADYSLIVRLVDINSNTASIHEAPFSRNYWFACLPDRTYRTEVGFFAQGGMFLRLLTSNEVRTPRGRVSPRKDSSPEFSTSSDEFARILEQAGFLADALEVSLEAADEATKFRSSKLLASQLGNVDVPDLTSGEQAELRGILAAMAMGEDIRLILEELSDSLREWLLALLSQRADLSQLHILALLRSLLGIETSAVPHEAQPTGAVHAAVGASEVNLPSPPIRMWMPSMTVGRLKL
jgi:hypothetical protein